MKRRWYDLVWVSSGERTVAILGDRWWRQAAKQGGNTNSHFFLFMHGRNVMSAKILQGSIRRMNGALYQKGTWSKAEN